MEDVVRPKSLCRPGRTTRRTATPRGRGRKTRGANHRRHRCRLGKWSLNRHGSAMVEATRRKESRLSKRNQKMTFTCNKCGIRTERRVNKDNLTAGTTWVQCGNPSCSVWHKIVDNLGLVYECSDDILE